MGGAIYPDWDSDATAIGNSASSRLVRPGGRQGDDLAAHVTWLDV